IPKNPKHIFQICQKLSLGNTALGVVDIAIDVYILILCIEYTSQYTNKNIPVKRMFMKNQND
ncbi:hypothetical protein, partial [Sediminibacterium sp.]|uniref:hypothetical protein n=1 Tax=Sediminibacterium sp. TaxID=1917865 RepID=UPI003F695709